MKIKTIYIIGVSGCGKTTIGTKLADKINWSFKDGDDFHSIENREKMKSGVALTDNDRLPWLETIHAFAKSHENCVIACSALKLKYRNILRSDELHPHLFFLLQLDRETLQTRVSTRTGHFMPPNLLQSQLSTLELPNNSETDVIIIDSNSKSVDQIVLNIYNKIFC